MKYSLCVNYQRLCKQYRKKRLFRPSVDLKISLCAMYPGGFTKYEKVSRDAPS